MAHHVPGCGLDTSEQRRDWVTFTRSEIFNYTFVRVDRAAWYDYNTGAILVFQHRYENSHNPLRP